MSTTKQTLLHYFKANWQFKGLFITALLSWTGGYALQRLVLPIIVAGAFDTLITSGDSLQWSMFTGDIMAFVMVFILAQITIDVGLLLQGRMESRVMPRLYNLIYEKLIYQSTRFHNNSFSGSLVTQVNRFVNAYIATTDTFMLNFTQLIILTIASSAILFWYAPILGGVVIIWIVYFLAINYHLTKRRIALSRARALADTKLTGYLADSLSNVAAVKASATEKYEQKKFAERADDKATKTYRYWVRSISNDAVYGVSMGILQLSVLVVSIYLIKNGSITPGVLILAQVYITQTIANLWGLSGIIKNLEHHLSDAAEMTELLAMKTDVTDAKNAKDIKVANGAIDFKKIHFTHAENDDPLFTDLNLKIRPGEKIGLVGKSGGGKTTITKLLLRFNDIQSGEISIDSQNIASVTQRSLRQNIAYVPQEPILFHRTLAENIAYGTTGASEATIKKVSKLAHAHEFIKDLPKGYDTLVGERGVKLSGGQRQRVAIARAMIKDAPILVLDEATSALDSESEVLIQDALWKLMEGRTAIVIAHRLSTIQKMDRIIVMDNGKIIEEGTHKELIAKGGTYAELWNHQSGGFMEE